MEENQNEREFITLEDEDGKEIEFELIAKQEFNEHIYYAVIPVEDPEKVPDGICEYVILKEEADENGELTLATIDDDEEFDDIADRFDDMFSEEIDYDDSEEQ